MIMEEPFQFSFEPDEVFVDKGLEGYSEKDLLTQKEGLFKVTEVEKVLKLHPGTLRSMALKIQKEGKSPYRDWGIGKSAISHWVVRIKVFRDVWEREIKPLIKNHAPEVEHIPKSIGPRELVQLEGVFKLADLKGKFPFSHQSIKNQARKLGSKSRDTMGCWKEGAQFYVDMQPFLKWLSTYQYR